MAGFLLGDKQAVSKECKQWCRLLSGHESHSVFTSFNMAEDGVRAKRVRTQVVIS